MTRNPFLLAITFLGLLMITALSVANEATATAPPPPVPGSVHKFPDGWYQIFLATDDATGTTFWVHAPGPKVNCMDMPVQEVFGIAPKSVSFLDDEQSRRLILAAGLPLVQWYLQRCGGAPWADVWIMHEDYQLLRGQPRQDPRTPWIYYRQLQQGFFIGPIAVNGRVFYEYQASKISLPGYINFVRQADAHRREVEAKAKKQTKVKQVYDAFVIRYGVQAWPPIRELVANPFVLQGKVVGVQVTFSHMLSPTEALFQVFDPWEGTRYKVTVSNVPTNLFTKEQHVILAGRVKDRVLEFVGVHVCRDAKCSDILPGGQRGER